MYSIRETQDFYPLSLLYQESGLEVTPGHTPPQGTLSMLRCEDSETGELVAAATLQHRAGHFVLGSLGGRFLTCKVVAWEVNCSLRQSTTPSSWAPGNSGWWERFPAFTPGISGTLFPEKWLLPFPAVSPAPSSKWTVFPAL